MNFSFEDEKRCPDTGRFLPTTKFDYVGWNLEEFGIYQITNKINGKIYIGSCYNNNFKTRWLKHLDRLNKGSHSNLHLQSSWNKYGEEVFIFSVVESLDRDKVKVFEIEQHYIDTLIIPQHDYNMSFNANGGSEPRFSKEECEEIIDYFLNVATCRLDLEVKFKASCKTFSKIFSGGYYNSKDIDPQLLLRCREKGVKTSKDAALESNKKARKVSKEDAIEIYNTYKSCTIKKKRDYYAEKYNVSKGTIGDIVSGRTYNDWTGAPEHLKKHVIKKKKQQLTN